MLFRPQKLKKKSRSKNLRNVFILGYPTVAYSNMYRQCWKILFKRTRKLYWLFQQFDISFNINIEGCLARDDSECHLLWTVSATTFVVFTALLEALLNTLFISIIAKEWFAICQIGSFLFQDILNLPFTKIFFRELRHLHVDCCNRYDGWISNDCCRAYLFFSRC